MVRPLYTQAVSFPFHLVCFRQRRTRPEREVVSAALDFIRAPGSDLALYQKISQEGFHFDLVDARVYAPAVHDWLSGEDAYRITPQVSLLYLYPPVFLYTSGWLARLLTSQVGWMVFLTLHFAAALSLPWMLYRFYLRESDCTLP